MRLAIMQPYFFPYLGHFSLIASVDQWVVFDITQYTPRTWINRNRILHPKSGWQYITIPLANSSTSIKIAEAKILDLSKAKRSMLGKISHYKKKAPYYYQVVDIIERVFNNVKNNSLVSLNINALQEVCHYLDIPFLYQVCSDLSLDYPLKMQAGDWALYISDKLGATEYINPVSGKEIFNKKAFLKKSLSLYFIEFSEFKYNTPGYIYEPNLSILDVLMWNNVNDIRNALNNNVLKQI
ncbi:WbqC family protein [Legionella israelensis]|nr:WbqC family protein [Legionella israelensis]